MSIAWTTLVVVVLLLPGVFFLSGFAFRERMTREVVRASAIGDIGIALLTAIVLHWIALGCLTYFGYPLHQYLAPLISPDQITQYQWQSILKTSPQYFAFYVVAISLIGFLLGLLLAGLVAAGYGRFLATHPWVYDLISKRGSEFVTAYVMTNIKSGSKVLMYKGRVKDVYLTADGRIAYLLLQDCSRYNMNLDSEPPSTGQQTELFADTEVDQKRVWNYMALDGSTIANVLFDKGPKIAASREGVKYLDDALERLDDESRALIG